jgi:hypothetical protein
MMIGSDEPMTLSRATWIRRHHGGVTRDIGFEKRESEVLTLAAVDAWLRGKGAIALAD